MLLTRRFAVFAAVGIVATASAAHAQTSWSVAAGATAPTGGFGDGHDMGYHVLVGVGMHPPLAPIGFRLDGMFNEFNVSSSSDLKTRVFVVTANGVLNTSGLFGPYLIGGVGLYSRRETDGFGDSNDFGVNIGGGFRFALTGFSAFAEARYHRVGDGLTTFIPITFGITF